MRGLHTLPRQGADLVRHSRDGEGAPRGAVLALLTRPTGDRASPFPVYGPAYRGRTGGGVRGLSRGLRMLSIRLCTE